MHNDIRLEYRITMCNATHLVMVFVDRAYQAQFAYSFNIDDCNERPHMTVSHVEELSVLLKYLQAQGFTTAVLYPEQRLINRCAEGVAHSLGKMVGSKKVKLNFVTVPDAAPYDEKQDIPPSANN